MSLQGGNRQNCSAMRLLLQVLVLVLIAIHEVRSEACQVGWFGSRCQYKCHCTRNSCLDNGACQDGAECQLGWFGPGCQYQDLSVMANLSITPAHHGSSVLTDGADDTCIFNVESINVVWKTPYLLTWIRIVGTHQPFTLRFKENPASAYKDCLHVKIVEVSGTLVQDVYCTTNTTVTQLTLAWSQNVLVCSLYVSGGRNVALKETSTQSSTIISSTLAGLAVDGLTTTYSHTDTGDKTPFWLLTFSAAPLINRFVIYNRADFPIRLRGFSIDVYNKNSTRIFKYTDTDPTAELVYFVTFTRPFEPVSQVKISLPSEYLHISEVEIYGDSSCPAGWYGPECNKKCQCSDPGEACLVMTGGCSSGCAPGYHGDSCDQECLPGFWGVNCLQRCRSLCYGHICDRITGRCVQGCVQESNSPECKVDCDRGWFGANCQYKCHCTNKMCDESGLCLNDSHCELGWFGPACQYQDRSQAGNLTMSQHNVLLVSDGDDESCVLNLASIVIEWTTPIPFTWLRLIVLEPDYHDLVTFQFKAGSADGRILNCTNPRKDLIDRRTTDFYCDIHVTVSQLIIHLNEKRSVCSVYVSGGRNVALRQYASQSSTYSKMGYNLARALNAVDGSTLSSYSSGSCSRTDVEDPNPSWTLSFQIPQIVNRLVIYNNYEINDTHCCPGGLHEFKITSSNGDVIYEFNSSDVTLKHPQKMYNILVSSINQDPITSVTIESTVTDDFHTFERFIALCEVEIYGDSMCPFGKYGRDCRGTCRCAVDGESCFVTTGGCQSGCAPGYYGEGCVNVCPEGTWGIDCREKCSVDCLSFCNVKNGDCDF
ncbi:unnamed protein product [Lymnaea stagnalis]|uniref:Fucolectin tachylectin-4 pentraxin-1 domain-containing protein n=1 Tax=Lymnaea stagnalis TaxID=6523 RepID=A0AAV2HSA2_LYMST